MYLVYKGKKSMILYFQVDLACSIQYFVFVHLFVLQQLHRD